MKITIEHEAFNATTTSLLVAQRLLDTIRMLEDESKPKTAMGVYNDLPIYQDISEVTTPPKVITVSKKVVKDIFDTKNTEDVPEQVLKPKAKKIDFSPSWLEKEIDFTTQKIVRYSNPCSTLHGHNGGKVWQTELWIETNGEIDTCDCEYADLDKLHEELDAIVNQKTVFSPKPKIEKHTKKPKTVCSRERLQEVADLVNRGCTNGQIAEILGLARTSASKYKNECKRQGLLQ